MNPENEAVNMTPEEVRVKHLERKLLEALGSADEDNAGEYLWYAILEIGIENDVARKAMLTLYEINLQKALTEESLENVATDLAKI